MSFGIHNPLIDQVITLGICPRCHKKTLMVVPSGHECRMCIFGSYTVVPIAGYAIGSTTIVSHGRDVHP